MDKTAAALKKKAKSKLSWGRRDPRGKHISIKTVNRDTILNNLRALKPELEKRYGVRRIGVFGSIARNEGTQTSDVDVVVEMQPDLFKRARLKVALEAVFGRKVDVVRYRSDMNKYLKKRIEREALYA
jgi:predicted nucleotidyltransferase